MRRIIDGRSYDTGTATRVGEYDSGGDGFDDVWEELCRKRNGEYFLHGIGGARTRYAKRDGLDGWAGGEGIVPLSYDEARDWARQCLDADAYEAEFGAVSEGDGEVAISVRVSEEARARLDLEARRSGRTKGAIVTGLLLTLGE